MRPEMGHRAVGLGLVTLGAMAGCFTRPDTSQRLSEQIVATRYDLGVDFATFGTFAVRREVGVVSAADGGTSSLDESVAQTVTDAVARNLLGRGYIEVPPDAAPDLGL